MEKSKLSLLLSRIEEKERAKRDIQYELDQSKKDLVAALVEGERFDLLLPNMTRIRIDLRFYL